MSGLSWMERAQRVRSGELEAAHAPVEEPIDSYRRLFDALLKNSFDSVVLCTSQGEYLAVSTSFCRLTGYEPHELLGQTSVSLGLVDPTGTRRTAGADITAHLPGMYKNRLTRKDGEQRYVEFSQQLLDDAHTLVIVRDITERQREELMLLELASTDPLTGLMNRRSFESKVTAALAATTDPVHLVLADLDELKSINDTFGHARGDESLRIFPRTLLDIAIGSPHRVFPARLGGDEFALIVIGGGLAEVDRLMGQVRARLAHPNAQVGNPISASVGVAERISTAETLADLLARADEALYREKRIRRS